MNGLGVLKGLGVTLRHFFETYLEDFQWAGKGRYNTPKGIAHRSSTDVKGIFTVQFPEEELPVPEEFRFMPFLVYDEGPAGEKNIRCTSCGICAKVCPPQCIWIVRTNDPVTNRPIPAPADFNIDVDVCMNCGLCAEYCPFDAIKMDHDYKIASYDRLKYHIFTKDRLLKPASYYNSIRPLNSAQEAAVRAEKEASKTVKKEAAA